MSAVYYHMDADGRLLYVGRSVNPFARFGNHRCVSPWGRDVARIEIKWFDTDEEALAFEAEEIKRLQPPHNGQLTPRQNKKRRNEAFKYVADWERRFGGCGVQLGVVAGCSLNLARRLSVEPTYPRFSIARKIAIASSGYVPASAFYSGATFLGPVSDEDAEEEVRKLRIWGTVDADVLNFAQRHSDFPPQRQEAKS